MTKTPINYSNTVIYKIVCNDLTVTDLYVGSTTAFTKRKNAHKSYCNNENGRQYNYKIYQIIRANGGWCNWTMVEIEKYTTCIDGNQARARERYWLEFLKANMNVVIPGRTGKEWEEANKDKKQQYRDDNKEKKKEYDKVYREKKKEYDKVYRENNKERKKEYDKQRRLIKKQEKLIDINNV